MLKIFKDVLFSYFKAREGATAIEYGLIAAGISLAIVAVVFTFGDELATLYGAMEPAVQNMQAEIVTNN